MKRLIPVLLVGILVIAFILSGCTTATTPTTSSPATSSQPASSTPASTTPSSGPTEILVGVPAALTGGAAGFGEGGVFGLQAAVDDLNKTGGIMVADLNKKLPVRLIIQDNGSDPNKAGTLAEQMILQNHVNVLISTGPLDFNPPMAVIAERNKVPFLAGPGPFEAWNAQRTAVTPPWQYSWMSSFAIATPPQKGDFRDGLPGYTMFDAWSGALKSFQSQTNGKIALLASADPDGNGWYQAFAPEVAKLGMTAYKSDQTFGLVPGETTDFSSLIQEWKAADCQLLWANCPAPFFGAFWKQAQTFGYKPKQVFATRAGLFYTDIVSWNNPNGICNEMFWNPSIKDAPGIGDTTPASLDQRWITAKNQPTNQCVGWLYPNIQVIADAIQRAGSLNGDKINQALSQTDLKTIDGRIVFDSDHYSRIPVAFGQWQAATGKAYKFDNLVVYSDNASMATNGTLIFPIP
jgi:branched-chain amino acid transport system substrate-binding protein